MSTANPEGQLIGSSSKPWRIGKMLGKGACGSVHEIARVPSSTSQATTKKVSTATSDFVIKIAPYIKPAGTKGKKRKKTAMERNADLLLHENTLYKNVFNKLRGRLIPDVPIHGSPSLIPPGFGEINGFRFFVMERMAAPLFEIVSILCDTNKADGKPISLGDTASAMITCLREIHEHRHVFIDVKPENFMLANSNLKTKNKLGQRIRILDLGLVESFHDMTLCGHRENNFPNSQFVGTPLYASLNVLEGHTPSRRDDLEALLYIISEMILMIIENKIGDVLPWSQCKSDDAILKMKKEEIDNNRGNSVFFQRLRANGNDHAGKAIKDAFSFVRMIKYSEKPKYSQLEELLQELSIYPGGSKQNESKSNKRKTSTKSSAKQKKDHCVLKVVDRNASTALEKKQKKSQNIISAPRRSRRLAKTDATESSPDDVIVIEETDQDSEDDIEHHEMMHNVENIELSSTRKNPVNASSMKINFISGAHKGESIILEGSMILGRDPELAMKTSKRRNQQQSSIYPLKKEKEASASHVSLALCSKGKGSMNSVRVTDLNSTNGTFVNGKEIPKGGYRQAFSGDKILIGKTMVQIKKISI